MEVSNVEMYKSIEPVMGKETAEKLISFIENGKASKEFVKDAIDATKSVYLTKDDKVELVALIKQLEINTITKIDAGNNRNLIIILSAISLATVLSKLL